MPKRQAKTWRAPTRNGSPNGDDFKAIKSGDLAVTTMTMHVAFTSKVGATTQMQVRVTDVWEKQDRKWLVVHEHASVPSR